MTTNEEALTKKLEELEEMNRSTIQVIEKLSKSIKKTIAQSKENTVAIQIIARELKIEDVLRAKMKAKGYQFEFDPFL